MHIRWAAPRIHCIRSANAGGIAVSRKRIMQLVFVCGNLSTDTRQHLRRIGSDYKSDNVISGALGPATNCIRGVEYRKNNSLYVKGSDKHIENTINNILLEKKQIKWIMYICQKSMQINFKVKAVNVRDLIDPFVTLCIWILFSKTVPCKKKSSINIFLIKM